ADVGLVQRSVGALRALFMAGGIRRARHQRDWLAGLLARQSQVAARQHGPAPVRTAERRRVAARGQLVLDHHAAGQNRPCRRARAAPGRLLRISVRIEGPMMDLSRRLFIRNGVATVSLGFAAPEFLTAIAQAQGLPSRRLVVVYLGGGNDALNTLVPYLDAA